MEPAHVLLRLHNDDPASSAVGILRTSATTVRLEHSEMSPGVASITFEQVFDVHESTLHIFETSLVAAIDALMDGKAMTVIVTGATRSGKSFTCHGDQLNVNYPRAPGLIALAIARVFCTLTGMEKPDGGGKYNVLVSCWGVGRCETSRTEGLVDLFATKRCVSMEPSEYMEDKLVESAVVVSDAAEAMTVYLKALKRVQAAEKQDFVFALHVESRLPNGEAKRGRFLLVDIHGDAIIEPRSNPVETKEHEVPHFKDTHLQVHEILSAAFGSFVGHDCATYFVVTLQTSTRFQQQAIQSLLYACRAKEIKSSSSIKYLAAFVEKRSLNELLVHIPTDSGTPHDDWITSNSRSNPARLLDHSSLSSTSSDSTCESPVLPHVSPTLEHLKVSWNIKPSLVRPSEDLQKQLAVSKRVRKAYELAKAASNWTKKSMTCPQTDASAAHAMADELLHHLPRDTLCHLTLEAKLKHISSAQMDLKRALAQEVSVKDEWVKRMAELSQSRIELEHKLQEALAAKEAVEIQVQNLLVQFDAVGSEVTRLQEEMKQLKAKQCTLNGQEDGLEAVDEKRAVPHAFLTRLDEALVQAKDVMTFKDETIQALEKRLELASKRGADALRVLEDERMAFAREKADLLLQLEQSKEEKSTTEGQLKQQVAKVKTENMEKQQLNAELREKVNELTLERVNAQARWAQEACDREKRAEERCRQRVFQAEDQLAQASAAMQHQMAHFQAELDVRMTRQRLACQVACKASQLKAEQLGREVQRVKAKRVKLKVKMETKARVVVENTVKEHNEAVALLKRRIETIVEREQSTIRRIEKKEDTIVQLQKERHEQQTVIAALKEEHKVVASRCDDLKRDKEELECRLRGLEESVAQQVQAAVQEEGERVANALKEHHDQEIYQLKCIAREQDAVVSQSGSSEEDRISPADAVEQWSIDELDAHVLLGSNHRRQAATSSLSASSSPSTKTTTSSLKRALASKDKIVFKLAAREQELLEALAVANEQETLAKKQVQETQAQRQRELMQYDAMLQELNRVKKENWNLSLALHVTEATSSRI